MNRFLFLCLALLMIACFSEDKVDLASPTTFTRYYNDGYDNEPIAVEETADGGLIMLINSSIQDSEAEAARNKITLIKTDQFGGQVWKEYFPAINPDPDLDILDWKGYSLTIIENNGYLITGESINAGKSSMLVMKVDSDGQNPISKVYTSTQTSSPFHPNYSTVGRASTLKISNNSSNGNYLFLASSDFSSGKMVVGEFDKGNLNLVWQINRGDDFSSNLTNRLFYNINGDSLIYWGGTVIKTSGEKSDIRFTKNPVNGSSSGDPNLGYTTTPDVANDMCLSGNVFCFVGSIDKSTGGNNRDIFFYKGTSNSDTASYKKEFINLTQYPDFSNTRNEDGNSISGTKDGGFIILGTIDTYTGIIGRGNTDILLLKVNGFGGYQWSKPFGSLDADTGVSIRQTSDGGYIVLAKTRLAGTNTVMLMKTDKNGDVD